MSRLKLEHRPRPRPVERVRFGLLVKAGFFALGIPARAFCSIDVTFRCNLRCRHCYFLEQGYRHELSVRGWERLLERLRREAWPQPHFAYQCSWVGGEPLLRREVVERCRRFFPYNIVVTNGTIPLPDWPDVHFFVSVDGTRELHDAIRGAGTHDRICANARRDDRQVMITVCLNRLNAGCVEQLLIEWDRTPVKHIAFEFHTPIHGLQADAELALSPAERDEVLLQLLELKRIYRHFILPPARTYRLMLSENAREVTDSCLYRRAALVLGPDGEPKRPCMLGPGADCDRCGCIIPFVTRAQVDRREVMRDLWSDARRLLGRGAP